MTTVTGIELQIAAQAKIDDAVFLLANGRYANAYYLAGYALEIGLKACIAKQFVADAIPDRAFVNAIHTHNLSALLGLAGLADILHQRKTASAAFATNWALVCQWKPDARYDVSAQQDAQDMIDAMSDPIEGVFPWIRAAW